MYNQDLPYELVFVVNYMNEDVIYHTDNCSFMWVSNDVSPEIYFMEFYATGLGSTLVKYYTIRDDKVKSYKEVNLRDFNQVDAFSSYLVHA